MVIYAWVSPCPRERATHSRRERYSEDVWSASVLFWDRAPTVRPFTLWRPFHSGHHKPPVAPPTFTLWRAVRAAPFDRNTTPVLPAIASYSPLWDPSWDSSLEDNSLQSKAQDLSSCVPPHPGLASTRSLSHCHFLWCVFLYQLPVGSLRARKAPTNKNKWGKKMISKWILKERKKKRARKVFIFLYF